MADELELKYAVDDADALVGWLDRELPATDGADGTGWRTVELTDTYFDTAGQALARAGYAARLRRVGRQTTVEVKSDIAVDRALHRRAELEADATAVLDPGAWPASEVRELIAVLADGGKLVARFMLRQQRRVRDVGGFELSVDDVSIRKGRREVGQLHELEVELKSGRRSGLRRVGRQLERSGLVRAEPRSKMAIAAALVEGPPPIYPSDPLAEAGRKILARLLDRLVERDAAMREGEAVALKQMRVATRRIRAVWRSFAGAYRSRDARRYVEELRGIARHLGQVRDMDVLLEALPDDSDLDPLRESWQQRRDALYQELVSELDSRAYRRFLDDYRQLADTAGEAATQRGRSTRVVDSAAALVWAGYERLRVARPPLTRSAVPDDLHALRIAARQFRYTLEAFRDVLAEPATARLMERLVHLQDTLGALNDADVARQEVETWIGDHPEFAGQVGPYHAHLQGEVTRLTRSVGPSVAGVLGLTFRRLLGRSVAAA